MIEDTRFDLAPAVLSENVKEDYEELTTDEITELVEEAIELRWSSKPTTASGRCC